MSGKGVNKQMVMSNGMAHHKQCGRTVPCTVLRNGSLVTMTVCAMSHQLVPYSLS